MKRKLFISVVSVILCVVALAFTGCSCNPASALSFNSAWNNEDNRIGYLETTSYTVEYSKDFVTDNFNFEYNTALAKNVDFYFTDGTYSVTTEIIATPSTLPNYDGDILNDSGTRINSVIHQHSEFNIKSYYKYGTLTEHDVYNDFVIQDVYFCVSNASYTPVYAVSEHQFATLYADDNGAEIQNVHYKYEMIYSKGKYTSNKIDVDSGLVVQTKDYSYTFKTAIDNCQLLFAIRNVPLADVGSSFSLPAITPTYGAPQGLSVSRFADSTENFDLTINSTPYSNVSVPLKRVSFMASNAVNSGKAQLVYVQANAVENLANSALIMKYVEPLTAYGSFYSMGALVFTLNNVTINIPA